MKRTDKTDNDRPSKKVKDITSEDIAEAVEYMKTLNGGAVDDFSATTPTRGLKDSFNAYLQRIVEEEIAKGIPEEPEFGDDEIWLGSSTDGCSSDVEDY